MNGPWSYRDMTYFGDKPHLVGAYEHLTPGGCIVVGTSRETWKDLDAAYRLFKKKTDYDVIAINDIAHQLRKRINHIASLHNKLPGPLRQIRKVKMLEHVITHSQKPYEGVDIAWGAVGQGGTSGFFGVKLAYIMGYSKIVVCGIGMDDTGHYYDPEDHNWNGSGLYAEADRAAWIEHRRKYPLFRDSVRVMSGTLKDLFGEPTTDWIYQGQEALV